MTAPLGRLMGRVRRALRRRRGDAAAATGRTIQQPVLLATAVVVSLAVGAAGMLVFTGNSDSGAAPTTSVVSKGATIDTSTTTTTTVAPTTTTTTLESYTAVPDPDAPPDVNLEATVTTLATPPGEPFVAETLPTAPTLSLSSASPSTGKSGTAVQLVGTGLDRVTAVSFNGVRADSFTALSSTEIMTSVPMGATTGPIRLTSDGAEWISPVVFTAKSPSISAVASQAGASPQFGAARFDGEAGSYMSVPTSTDWNIRRGDFTVEWFQFQTAGTDCCPRVFTLGTYPWVTLGASIEGGYLKIRLENNWAIQYALGSPSNYLNRWMHIAVSRSAGILNLYIDGVRKVSIGNTGDIYFVGPLMIGAEASGSSTISEFPGYITNLHFVNGTALYTGATLTVPTGPINPVANTKLLLRFASPGDFLVDASPTRKTVTAGRVVYDVAATIGSTVTISGTNLLGTTSVSFGGVETTPVSVSATSVTATVPAGANSGPVTVKTPDGNATSSLPVTIITPSIRSLAPSAGSPGTVVTITGIGFSQASAVSFGGVSVPSTDFKVVSSTTITAKVPTSAYSGNVTVTTPGVTLTSDTPFVMPPRYTSLSTTRLETGKVVLFNGANLAETTSVTFAGSEQLAAFTVVSSTQLSITVPADAGTGAIRVANAAGSVVSAAFTVAPTVSELVPSTGPAGVQVFIRGAGFTGTTQVKYGGVSASFVVNSPSEIAFIVPSGATTSATVLVGSLVTGPTYTLLTAPNAGVPGTDGSATVSAPTPSGGTTATAAALVGTTTVALGGGLSMALTSSSLVGAQLQGSGTATLGSFRFPAAFSYTSPGNWTLTASSASSVGSMRIGSTNISVTGWSGSIIASAGTNSWSLRARTAASSALIPATSSVELFPSQAVIAGAAVRLVPTCPDYATSTMCASAPTAYVRVEAPTVVRDGDFSFYPPVWSDTARGLDLSLPGLTAGDLLPFRSVLNPVSGAFVLRAAYPLTAPVLCLSNTFAAGAALQSVSLTLANGDPAARLGSSALSVTGTFGGFDVLASGTAIAYLSGYGKLNMVSVKAAFDDMGCMAVTGDVPSAGRVAELAVASFAFVRNATTVTLGSTVVQVGANTIALTGTIKSPAFLKRYGINGALLNSYALYNDFPGVLKIYASLPIGVSLPSIPGMTSSIDSLTLGLEIPLDPALADLTATLSGQGTITPKGRGAIAVTLQGTYNFVKATTELSMSAASPTGDAVWANVFGVSGFDLNSLAVQVGTTEVFPYVSVGLMGTGTVPQVLRKHMGIDTSRPVPTSFTANLSTETPCLEVTVGSPDSTSAIIALPPGMNVLTATYATIRASVDGCRVGTIAAMSEVAPGVEVGISGSLLGSPVSFYGKFDPTPVGPYSTPTFLGWTDVGMKNVPGIAFDASYRMSVAAGGWTVLPKSQVRGGIRLGSNARIALSGSCEVLLTGPRCDVSGAGAIAIAGFNLNMAVTMQGWGSPSVVFAGSAAVRVGGVRMTLAGTFGTVGVSESSTMDNPGLTYSFSASGKLPGPILDTFSLSIVKTPGTTVLPTGKLSASGTIGGVFAKSLGSTRWSGSTSFNPSMANVTVPASFTIPIGVANVPVTLKLKLCLTGSCAGTVTPVLDVNFTFLRQRIDIYDIPVDPTTWDFSYRLQTSISKSGRAGDSWGGIKGTVTSAIDFSISSSSVSLASASATAKAYIGIGGTWNLVGNVGVSFNGSTGEYCFSASGKKLCV